MGKLGIVRKSIMFCTLAMVCGAAVAQDAAPADPQTARSFSRQVCKTYTGDYLLYLPDGYEQGETAWPLMLFLHGAGERGNNLDQVKLHGPPKLIAAGRKFPFIVVSPQCPRDSWWNSDHLSALLDEICANYRVDLNRIYVTGLSMGGFGTWDLSCKFPYRFAAIAPICGGGDPREAGRLKTVPVWAFHGAKDTLVVPERTEEMINEIRRVGGLPKYTLYPEAGHDSWTEAYNTDELYEWMLSQELYIPPLGVDAAPYVPGEPLTVMLRTSRARPIDVTVSLAGGEPVALTVSQTASAVKLDIPTDASGTLEMTMTLDGRKTQRYWLKPAVFQTPRAGDIEIDGKLEDWPAGSEMPAHSLAANPEDFSPEIRLAWSPKGLYLALKTPAPRLGDAKPNAFWGAPNMEVFVDAVAPADAKGWPATSHQFFILPVKVEGEDRYRVSIGEWQRSKAIAESIFDDERCQGAMTHEDDVLTLEWFIPAEAIGASPAAGQSWRCGLAVNASIPHHPVGGGSWPRSKDYGLLAGVDLIGSLELMEGK